MIALDATVFIAHLDSADPLRLAELRAGTGLKLPDCCALDVAIHNPAGLAAFDGTLAAEARKRGVFIAP